MPDSSSPDKVEAVASFIRKLRELATLTPSSPPSLSPDAPTKTELDGYRKLTNPILSVMGAIGFVIVVSVFAINLSICFTCLQPESRQSVHSIAGVFLGLGVEMVAGSVMLYWTIAWITEREDPKWFSSFRVMLILAVLFCVIPLLVWPNEKLILNYFFPNVEFPIESATSTAQQVLSPPKPDESATRPDPLEKIFAPSILPTPASAQFSKQFLASWEFIWSMLATAGVEFLGAIVFFAVIENVLADHKKSVAVTTKSTDEPSAVQQ